MLESNIEIQRRRGTETSTDKETEGDRDRDRDILRDRVWAFSVLVADLSEVFLTILPTCFNII